MGKLPPSPGRLVAAAAIIGVGVPLVATTLLYALAPAVERMPGLLRAPAFVLTLSLRLLWPPIGKVWELRRQGLMPNDFLPSLIGEALLNGLSYAALGALLWYALYRRRWAWLAIAGVLIFFWSLSRLRLTRRSRSLSATVVTADTPTYDIDGLLIEPNLAAGTVDSAGVLYFGHTVYMRNAELRANYTVSLSAAGGTLTGTQVWTRATGGDSVTRTCKGTVFEVGLPKH
jgi:hypothetical protein